jgi:hypothetical protein
MIDEGKANLLRAYRLAVEAGQDGIADLLEDVILGLMGSESPSPIVIGGSRTTTEPPWRVTCGPYVVDTKMQCTGIDPMNKETTA